ncbi:MAG TPA: aminopeptidase P family protein [Firmicutes bacterium]|nr:aminopeptidase P family protein [Bacillota bacterium]
MNISINYPRRIQKIQDALNRHGIDVYIAVRTATVSYTLGAFAPWRTAVIIPQSGPAIGLLWENDASRLKEDTWMDHVIEWGARNKCSFTEAIANTIRDLGLDRGTIGVELAVEGARTAPGLLLAIEYEDLKKLLPSAHFVNATGCVDQILAVKEKEEILLMRQVSAIADIGFAAALDALKAGKTENEIAGVAEYAMRCAGSEWAWSVTAGTEVGSGYRSAYYLGFTQPATNKIIQRGDMVIIDLHPMYRLYYADFAANAVVGPPTSDQQKLAHTWVEAVTTLVKGMVPGAVISEVARAAYEKIKNNGLDRWCIPSFGHGIGTCSRIPPLITLNNHEEFVENMVVNAGTHIYWPGVGGMRLELPVLVTPGGGEPLCKTPLQLHVVQG